jgi:hypothetical protein
MKLKAALPPKEITAIHPDLLYDPVSSSWERPSDKA